MCVCAGVALELREGEWGWSYLQILAIHKPDTAFHIHRPFLLEKKQQACQYLHISNTLMLHFEGKGYSTLGGGRGGFSQHVGELRCRQKLLKYPLELCTKVALNCHETITLPNGTKAIPALLTRMCSGRCLSLKVVANCLVACKELRSRVMYSISTCFPGDSASTSVLILWMAWGGGRIQW